MRSCIFVFRKRGLGYWLFLFLLCCGILQCPWAGEAREVRITDMAGREHRFERSPQKLFALSPTGTILLYTFAPDMMCGWNYVLTEKEAKYILPEYRDLPVLGGWFGKATGNPEEILRARPDALLAVEEMSPASVIFAEKIEQQLNLPVLLLDASLEELGNTYRLLGEITGRKAEAERLGSYCEKTLKDVKALVASVPSSEHPRIYYAEGPKGLHTDAGGSSHVQSLGMLGGINVVERESASGRGMKAVTLEQIYLWNPDLILSWSDSRGGYYSGILEDPGWASLRAVREKRVYEIPQEPFNWFDRPPSVNRVIGLRWLGKLFYPEKATFSLEEELRTFYSLFYHYDLSEEETRTLLENAL